MCANKHWNYKGIVNTECRIVVNMTECRIVVNGGMVTATVMATARGTALAVPLPLAVA